MVSNDPADPRTVSDPGNVVATQTKTLPVSAFRDMQNMDDALAALAAAGITPIDASELGDGFEMLDEKDKGQLVGIPFLIVGGAVSKGDYGNFVALRIMTRDGRKLVVTDGSTGIYDQIVNDAIPTYGTFIGLGCRHGLRASTYKFCENCKTIAKDAEVSACPDCGTSPMKPAATFYLDLSK